MELSDPLPPWQTDAPVVTGGSLIVTFALPSGPQQPAADCALKYQVPEVLTTADKEATAVDVPPDVFPWK